MSWKYYKQKFLLLVFLLFTLSTSKELSIKAKSSYEIVNLDKFPKNEFTNYGPYEYYLKFKIGHSLQNSSDIFKFPNIFTGSWKCLQWKGLVAKKSKGRTILSPLYSRLWACDFDTEQKLFIFGRVYYFLGDIEAESSCLISI